MLNVLTDHWSEFSSGFWVTCRLVAISFVIAMVAVVLALIGGAAFGATQVFGDDDDDDSPTVSAPATKDSDDDEDAPDAPDPTVPTVPTIPAPSDDAPAASGEFCTTMKDIQDSSMDALDSTDATDPQKLQDTAKELVSSYQSLQDSAPDELKSDVEVLTKYFETIQGFSTGDTTEMPDMSGYVDAASKVSQYYYQNCF